MILNKKKKNSSHRGRDRKLIAYTNPNSHITELYRSLRTNLDYTQVNNQIIRSVTVTSPNPSEGKTTTISNLAVTYAQQGKKVLLIDADLRKPNLQKVFRIENINGLSDVLMKKVELERSIREIKEVEGLFLMTSGFIPPNPSELLSSKYMNEMISELIKTYDIVLIDTPPVLVATDTQIISSLCDATILVIKSESTVKKEVEDSTRRLQQVKANLIGIVMNQTKRLKDTSYYQYK